MKRYFILLTMLVFFLNACDPQEHLPSTVPQNEEGASTAVFSKGNALSNKNSAFSSALAEINKGLEKSGAAFRLNAAEWLAAPTSHRTGQIIYANDRGNKQLSGHWVPGDPRRGGRFNITYLVDQSDGAATGGLTNAETESALDRAMETWEMGTDCSKFEITKVADSNNNPDVMDDMLGYGKPGEEPFVRPFADITHAGWMPKDFFDAIEPGLSEDLLGITFYFAWLDGNRNPTDIDRNGKDDTAFREIYYNNNFAWAIDDWIFPTTFDVETVALHEAGHGLSQAHFGKLFVSPAKDKLHFAPFAVMNAQLTRVAHELEGTDKAGHCSIWGNWPSQR